MEVRCAACGRHFYKKSGRHRFCTPACRYRGSALKQAQRYDHQHKRLRAQLAPAVATGPRLLLALRPADQAGEAWHLDHVDGAGPDSYRGPSHAYCNVVAASGRTSPEGLLEDDPESGVY